MDAEKATRLQGLDIDEGSDKSVADQIRDALAKNFLRVIDLFHEWDDDGTGTVSREEFHRAMGQIGLDVSPDEVDELFDTWDPDGSGELELQEVHKQLRQHVESNRMFQKALLWRHAGV